MDFPRRGGEEHEGRRFDPRLRGVADADGTPPVGGRRPAADGRFESRVQLRRGDPARALGGRAVDQPKKAHHAQPRQRRHERHRRVREILELLLQGDAELVGGIRLTRPAIPLVHHQDAGAPRFVRLAADLGVLVGHSLHAVHQDQDDIGPAHGGQRPRDAVPFHRPAQAAFGPDAGRIHQDVVASLVAEPGIDRVAGRPGLRAHHDALGPEDPVDQGRLAHVRSPHHGHRDGPAVLRGFAGVGNHGSHGIQEVPDPLALLGRNRVDGVEPQAIKVCRQRRLADGVDLVDDEENRPRRAVSEEPSDLGIRGRQSLLAVRQKQNRVRFGDRLLGLGPHLSDDPGARGIQPPGVHQDEPAAAPLEVAVQAVTGDPGQIVHDRPPPAEQAIEERGLADIRPADDGNDGGRHGGILSVDFYHRKTPATKSIARAKQTRSATVRE
ncbi:MAG: hypothetical protein H6Q86_2303 [candidate division NC10 bacterium]|nr:hypothetical protein [candidate division NC10 bacterium]